MKTTFHAFKKTIGLAMATLLLLAGCASGPTPPDEVAEIRSKLTTLQNDTSLASLAPIEIDAAERAIAAAEQSPRDPEESRHLLLIADQKVDIAEAWAQSRFYENQRAALTARFEAARLEARTREAEQARRDATTAQSQAAAAGRAADTARDEAAAARIETETARGETVIARGEATSARAETEQLQREIDELNARVTDRGLVVTLGDVLFETGVSELRGGTTDSLDRLAAFLTRYDTRTVLIEGHTDSVGNEGSNLSLSQRRADSVQDYLLNQGISASRLTATGRGQSSPIASNDSATGRQQNRRVEVIISNEDENEDEDE